MKRKYGETEQQAAERFITERRQAADLFPFLCSVFRAFDGKVFNKRLETALHADGRRIYAQKRNNNIDIWYYSASGEYMTLLYVPIPEDKRIRATDFITAASNKRAEYLREADHMAQILPTIETRRQQIEIIKHQLEGVLSGLSYTEQDIFNLHAHIRNY